MFVVVRNLILKTDSFKRFFRDFVFHLISPSEQPNLSNILWLDLVLGYFGWYLEHIVCCLGNLGAASRFEDGPKQRKGQNPMFFGTTGLFFGSFIINYQIIDKICLHCPFFFCSLSAWSSCKFTALRAGSRSNQEVYEWISECVSFTSFYSDRAQSHETSPTQSPLKVTQGRAQSIKVHTILESRSLKNIHSRSFCP